MLLRPVRKTVKKLFRVQKLKVDGHLPRLATYICPSKHCKYVGESSNDIMIHIIQHKSPIMPRHCLNTLYQNVLKQVAEFGTKNDLLQLQDYALEMEVRLLDSV